MIRIWPYVLGAADRPAAAGRAGVRPPFTFEMPELKGFNFAGGSRVIPEFVALTLALSTYTAAFIAEIVRAGILSVHKGQMEAGASLGLSRGTTLRLIVVPQAMRVILPPLTNQYLNLTKNSSLAVAIGYPDLFSVFAGTTLSQTGQAIEIIAITMGVYLADLARHQRDHELLRMAARPEPAAHERHRRVILRPQGPASPSVPRRSRPPALSASCARACSIRRPTSCSRSSARLLLWFTVVPAVKFLLVDAVWTGKDRDACLAENAGRPVGACWPSSRPSSTQFIYGFYPEAERWRVNLTFLLAARCCCCRC